MLSNDVRERVYKSLETDKEFCDRIRLRYPWYRGDNYNRGITLDEEIWDAFKIQRRIIERTSGC